MNQKLRATSCGHVLKYRGARQRIAEKQIVHQKGPRRAQRTLYLYTEFASQGNFWDLLETHRERKRCVINYLSAATGLTSDITPSSFPEHFIWYFLSQMTEALITFRTGTCNDPIPPVSLEQKSTAGEVEATDKPWQPLLHSDIKPKNIFCCEDNQSYPSYPRTVLSDFDLTHETKSANEWRFSETPDMQPPVSQAP